MTITQDNKYFPALTGVRAIAAFMVYAHHLNPVDVNVFGRALYDFMKELHIGVTLFFVLSGFLIAYRYSELSNFKFKNYMINRIARIYPMYFILTTMTFLFFAIQNHRFDYKDATLYFLNISFLRGFAEGFLFSGIVQGWSLTVEEIFYLLAPLIFVLIRKSKYNLLILPLCFITFGLILVHLFNGTNPLTNPYGFFGSYSFTFKFTFWGRCTEFFIGIALALLFKRKPSGFQFKRLTYIGMIVIAGCVYWLSAIKGTHEYGTGQPLGKVINTLILPLFGISLFYYGLLTEKTIVSKILESKLFVLLGKSSYIFYLIHEGIFSKLLHSTTSNYLVIFIAMNIISILMFKYIEEPLNNYIRNRFVKREQYQPAAITT